MRKRKKKKKIVKKSDQIHIKYKLSVNEVLEIVPLDFSAERVIIEYNKIKIRVRRKILHLIKQNGIECAKCKIKTSIIAVQRYHHCDSDYYHFAPYALNNDELIRMTIDHIKPISKGGKNELSNYQLMCYDCNQKKGSRYNIDYEN